MTQTALPAPRTAPPRRRVFFGLFDADGWSWALAKSLFWLVTMIMILGYLPDRAYYFTVQKTVDLGLLAWSPINFCPPENETLPCPAPQGATLPWHLGPEQVNLPAPRTDGVAGILGQAYVYAGGSYGSKPVVDTYVTHPVGTGNIDAWQAGPPLPEARADAAGVVVGNTLFVIGGYGPDGKATDTVFSLTAATDGSLGEWKTDETLKLPAPRAGSSVAQLSDGFVVMGGVDETGTPTRTVWKTQVKDNKFTVMKDQSPLFEENVDGVAAHVGEVLFLIGGRNASGNPVNTVQQGLVGGEKATEADPNAIIAQWRASAQTNLPVARTNMAGFTANGVLYVQGGSDGTAPQTQTYWTTPDAEGVIPSWQHLDQTDLGAGLQGSSAAVSGANAFLFGGANASGPVAVPARTNLAPQAPFFQLGILGATIPGLKLDGEVGQQIGYMNAALVGTADFILLILVGIAMAHRESVGQLIADYRARRRDRKAAKAAAKA